MNNKKKALQEFYNHNIENWEHFPRSEVRQQYLNLLNYQVRTRLSILDVGCGTGIDSQIISERLRTLNIEGYEALGIDFCDRAIELGNNKTISGDISKEWRFEVEDLFEFHTPKFFNIVLCSMVIMQYENIEVFFEKLSSFLDHKGQLLVVTNNPYLVSMEYSIAYINENSYDHIFEIEPEKKQITIRKYHHSLNRYFEAAKKTHLFLESYKEIYAYNNETSMFNSAEKNTYGYPNFIALHFIKR